ncbi:acyl-CoA dehydrogenase family protein [Modestobacter versicolor]|uniref:Acyl-CoA dehydrogenase n=1 Tax=Modestobacter versicolor TaxID=429133 RepID=A0A323VG22_9ACTN|nr:acyl-CoA dehydrogenase family protein [Modestobacter versicolor]MBB3677629.1 alkylation response protein AidB-like acyl-CoA dehydrogenase [Modestobacter versicolor]PZA22206.1 acyl-CoA dehydrogenase [Modestobacter versicolor]
MTDAVARARALAEELLFPSAAVVDAAGAVPRSHLDAIADAGLYGLTGPADAGGLDADPGTVAAVVEELASGELSTAFVWLQHLGVAGALRDGPEPLREAFLADLCAGRRRGGVALQAALRPGPAAVRVRTDGDGLVLDGTVPWVTGWGHVDLLLVAARDAADDVVFALVDAVGSATLAVAPQRMVAVTASATVELRLDGHRVPAGRVVGTVPLADIRAGDAAGLRPNGSLALGLVARCARLLGPSPLDGELAGARARLDAATPEELPAARAAASALAHRAAGLLVVSTGSSAVHSGAHAERLAREALFLLVFGSRPAIRAALVAELGG